MDSKLKKLTAVAAFSVILLIFLLVLLLNPSGNRQTAAGMGAETAMDGTASGAVQQDSGMVYQEGQIGNDLSAFLRDDTFFDPEDSAYLTELYAAKEKLSMIVTSVEKDLRIQIVDGENDPVAGESFLVKINGLGEYKDLDKDGVIYIGDLAAGEYEVSLQPVEGYRIPGSSTKVRVKDRVEYLVIEDISLLIRTEDEIDAEAEDTAQVVEDGDKTEIRKAQTPSGNAVFGIDVSKWQGEIDWDKVRNAGVEFAIIRCGYRGSVSGSLVEDPYFARNIKAAKAAGIQVGVYFFTQAVNEVEAVEEASMVVSLLDGAALDYPVFIDTESAGGSGRADDLDADSRTAVCAAFCSTIKNAGYEAGVYASRNWYYKRVDAAKLENYTIWLAEYRSAPLYQGYYQMWQYTSKGKIDGIDGNVDLNISYLGN